MQRRGCGGHRWSRQLSYSSEAVSILTGLSGCAMFNLDQAITDWRRQMIASGIRSRGVLDELENHLREDVDWKARLGVGEQAAFAAVVRQIGGADVLKIEFTKADG